VGQARAGRPSFARRRPTYFVEPSAEKAQRLKLPSRLSERLLVAGSASEDKDVDALILPCLRLFIDYASGIASCGCGASGPRSVLSRHGCVWAKASISSRNRGCIVCVRRPLNGVDGCAA
jgi:hypothetical protein